MSKVKNRLVQLVSGICSETTTKGALRQCADSSYPDSTVLKEFTKLPSVNIWLDEVRKLLDSKFLLISGRFPIIKTFSGRLSQCKSYRKLERRFIKNQRHVRNLLQ